MAIRRAYFRKPYDLSQRYGKDSWALVTGATAGIGLEACKYLAEKNMNVVICGRNKEKLQKAEEEIKKVKGKGKIRLLRLDLNESQDVQHYTKTIEEIKDLDVSVLVNNAGVLHCKLFKDMKIEEIKEMLETNIYGLTILTKLFVEKFYKRSFRSAIINVSSVGGKVPTPYLQFYTSTKAHVTSFTRALCVELSDKIDVLCHSPSYVETKMSKFSSGPHVASPRDCAETMFRDLGYEFENHPTLNHEFQVFILSTLRFLSENVNAIFTKIASASEYNSKFKDKED
jgi:17beta-estradiol 17-dehydrogenase / very-long-chain 3-oxoacyl-CoA reductase